jgi:hypothetical protein
MATKILDGWMDSLEGAEELAYRTYPVQLRIMY